MNNVLDLTTAHAQALLYNTWLDFYVANATDVDDFDDKRTGINMQDS